jgi:hypothetical protein
MAGERIMASLSSYRNRYGKADRRGRSKLLNEFCETTGYHRKYAITLLLHPCDDVASETPRRRRVSAGSSGRQHCRYITLQRIVISPQRTPPAASIRLFL